MKYVTYHLVYNNGYGTNPSYRANERALYFEPSAWVDIQSDNAKFLGYADELLDIGDFTDFGMEELSINEAIQFALAQDANAYLASDGKITVDFLSPVELL